MSADIKTAYERVLEKHASGEYADRATMFPVFDALKEEIADLRAALEAKETAEKSEREKALEEAARAAEKCYIKDPFKFALGVEAAAAIRTLAAQPAPALGRSWSAP